MVGEVSYGMDGEDEWVAIAVGTLNGWVFWGFFC